MNQKQIEKIMDFSFNMRKNITKITLDIENFTKQQLIDEYLSFYSNTTYLNRNIEELNQVSNDLFIVFIWSQILYTAILQFLMYLNLDEIQFEENESIARLEQGYDKLHENYENFVNAVLCLEDKEISRKCLTLIKEYLKLFHCYEDIIIDNMDDFERYFFRNKEIFECNIALANLVDDLNTFIKDNIVRFKSKTLFIFQKKSDYSAA